MSYHLKYIGPTQTFKAASLTNGLNLVDVTLEEGSHHIAELQQDGPTTMINGQFLVDPRTTMWVILPSLGGRIPYSPEAILRH